MAESRLIGLNKDGFQLGRWAATKRDSHRKGELPLDRVTQLQAIKGWDWDRLDANFQLGLSRLKAYVAEKGHAKVPFGWIDEDEFQLGRWAATKRDSYKKGKLAPEQVTQLQAIKGWTWE